MALTGVPALLVGLFARRRTRQLRRDGVRVWAIAMHRPRDAGGQLVTLQYRLPDGRVVEESAPARAKRREPPLLPGNKVLIWYDPADPAEILVYGREGQAADLAFVVVGAILALAGAIIAIVAPLDVWPWLSSRNGIDRDLVGDESVRHRQPCASWARVVAARALDVKALAGRRRVLGDDHRKRRSRRATSRQT
jgi:hypothetical protein